MRVTNLTSPRSGAKVANQYNIEVNGVDYFQSYDTVIAKKDNSGYTISSNYKYSNTTSKYFSQWLRDYGFNDNDIKIIKKWLSTAKNNDIMPINIIEQIMDIEGYTITFIDEL